MTSADGGALPKYLDRDRAVSQLGDAEALPPMLTMLEESLARDIPLIDICLRSGDLVGVNRLLHPMKGFLPIFCGPELCAELAGVEGLSKSSTLAETALAYAALRSKLEALLAEVSAFLIAAGAR
ncbi:MAG: Hpt domain-containing protein [Burkholderiales bacterium]|nr:Hpt domain-containing protein [Burkholderiales bacterium]